MKRLLTFVIAATLVFSTTVLGAAATNIPSPTKDFYVNDFAEVLDDTTESKIQSMALQLHDATKAQVVAVTVPDLGGVDLESYSLEMLRQWGIGDSKLNNGVLILLSVGDRKSRIEVGYGLEGALPDGKTGEIQDSYMIPYYKNNDFSNGMLGGFTKVVETVYEEYGQTVPTPVDATQFYVDQSQSSDTSSGLSDVNKALIIIVIVVLSFFDIVFNRGRMTRFMLWMMISRGGRGGGGSGGGFGGFSGGGGSGGGGGSSRGF